MQEILTGQYHHSLDAKGRLIVPAKFRDILGSQFKIGVSLDDCLTVYSKEGFEAFYQKLNALPSNQEKVRHLVRFFMGNTYDVELDKQGRILLPQQLRDKGHILKDVVFVGKGVNAELWSEEAFTAATEMDSREEMSAIAAELLEDGFGI